MSDKNIKAMNQQKPEESNMKSELNKGNLFEIVNPIKKETTSTFNTSVLMSNKFISQCSIKECSKNICDDDSKANNVPKTTKNLFVVYKESKIKKTGKKRSPYNLVDSNIRKLIIQEALRGRLLKSISEEFKINYSTIKTIWSIYRDELRTERKRGIKKSFTQTINMSNLKIDDYKYELGYVIVDEKHRKEQLASTLCNKLIEIYKNENVFAATKVINTSMIRILIKYNFSAIGNEFLSENKKYYLSLYTHTNEKI